MPESRAPHVVLGVTGGIAAYKAAELLRELTRRSAEVRVAMSRGALEFVTPLTFATLSKHPVHVDVWGNRNEPAVDHVTLAGWADLLLVAPATAHTIAKFAHGLADDFLSTYFLCHRGPVLVVPAMETGMWENPAVRSNREVLGARGVAFLGPDEGALASGQEGVGRMAEPDVVAAAALRMLSARRDMEGLRVLITAGPTRERVDPIRFLSNRSSGKMGYALAEAARDRGASVTLLAGPVDLPRPDGVRVIPFETASDLHGLLIREFPECDVLAMAAAVADFIPEESGTRLHREDGARSVRLEPGKDLLGSLKPLKRSQTVIAFGAETEDFERRGRRKMEAKGADLIVVNDVGRSDIGFESPENEVLILARAGEAERVSRRNKREVADRIWDALLRAGRTAPTSSIPR